MKTKELLLGLITSVLLSATSSNGAVIVAETSPGQRWAAETVPDHDLFSTPACLAKVQAVRGNAQLEVLAAKVEGSYVSPTVSLSNPKFSRQGLNFDQALLTVTVRGEQKIYKMLPAAVKASQNLKSTMVVKVRNRAEVIQAIKAGSVASVELYKDGRQLDLFSFSLTGSNNAYNSMASFCQIGAI